MKKYSTIICCICFAIGGFMIAATKNALSYNKTAVAAEPIVLQYPTDLAMGHKNNVGLTIVRDTVRDTIPLEVRHDTVTVVRYKTKVKWRNRRDILPDSISSKAKEDVDTIRISKPTIVLPIKGDSVSV